MNPNKIWRQLEPARVQITTGIVNSYFSSLSKFLPQMVDKAVESQRLMPDEVDRITLALFVQLRTMTSEVLRETVGRPIPVPIAEQIKSLAQKYKINLEDVPV
jgi:hypothetical protein